MTQRLTPELEEEVRADLDVFYGVDTSEVLRALLAEIDRLRAELAGAEERGAARELAAAVSFLRTTSAYWTLGDTPWGAAARRLERCDHRTGAAENE